MTTNGHLLDELAAPLARRRAGGVNVSLDTLDADAVPRDHRPRRPRARARRASTPRVAAGLRGEDERGRARAASTTTSSSRCARTRGRAARCRGSSSTCRCRTARCTTRRSGLSAAAIRRALEAALGALVAADRRRDATRARRATGALARDPRREVGIISAMTEHFCDDCNRLRLTATGELHACLGHDDAVEPARRRAWRRQRRRPRARDRRRGHRQARRSHRFDRQRRRRST